MAITVIGPARTMDTTPASPVVPKLLAFASQLSAQLGYDGGESVWASRENAQAVSRAAKT
jgi:hypothetical protein